MKKAKPSDSVLTKKFDPSTIGLIMDKIIFLPPELTELDFKNKYIISKTISVLPQKIQEKILNELLFVGLDGPYGQYEQIYLPTIPKNKLLPIVFLNFTGLRRKSAAYKMTVIAHEIAHFILKHESSNGGDEIEKETDDPCEKWGFGRGYKSYDSL